MANKKTIEEVKKDKITLESSIMDLITEFEESTGLKCTYMNIERKREDSKKSISAEMCESYEPYKGPVTNVAVDVNFDLLF